jgi:hypothetical protein
MPPVSLVFTYAPAASVLELLAGFQRSGKQFVSDLRDRLLLQMA